MAEMLPTQDDPVIFRGPLPPVTRDRLREEAPEGFRTRMIAMGGAVIGGASLWVVAIWALVG